MTKEMKQDEIDFINKMFDSPNAFTKWKFMQTSHFNKLPLAVRCTIEKECLTHYFNQITDGMSDWKGPISAVIPINLLNPMRKAVQYFTGTDLYVVKQDGDMFFKVAAKGYYMMGSE